MTWSIFLAEFVIITVAELVVKQLLPHLYYEAALRRVACIATQIKTFSAQQLASVSIPDWRSLRSGLKQHQINRAGQLRFRRDPVNYLTYLESQLL